MAGEDEGGAVGGSAAPTGRPADSASGAASGAPPGGLPDGPTGLDPRLDYRRGELRRVHLDADPLRQFRRWLADAAALLPEPNAMTLATVGADGCPAARMVLLREADAAGFSFYTHRTGRKAAELAAHPRAALLFHWAPLQRQVRVEGPVDPLPDGDADAYFAGRPRDSQLGAWASPQSQVIPDRAWLEDRLAEAEARFAGDPVPRPPHWGGYRLLARSYEFWQGRPGRLHDRFRYRKAEGGGWVVERLGP